MKFLVKGRDAISGAPIETTLEGWGLEEVEKLARRKHIDRATFQAIEVAEPSPPIDYASPATRLSIAPAMANPVEPSRLPRRRWIGYAALLVGVALATIAIVALSTLRPPAQGTTASPLVVTVTPPPAVIDNVPFVLNDLRNVQLGVRPAFGDDATEEVRRELSKDGEPVCEIFWSSNDSVRAMLMAIGAERGPRGMLMTMPWRRGDAADWYVPALARFASLANGDEVATDWSAWLRLHATEVRGGRSVDFRSGKLVATFAPVTEPEPGVSLRLVALK